MAQQNMARFGPPQMFPSPPQGPQILPTTDGVNSHPHPSFSQGPPGPQRLTSPPGVPGGPNSNFYPYRAPGSLHSGPNQSMGPPSSMGPPTGPNQHPNNEFSSPPLNKPQIFQNGPPNTNGEIPFNGRPIQNGPNPLMPNSNGPGKLVGPNVPPQQYYQPVPNYNQPAIPPGPAGNPNWAATSPPMPNSSNQTTPQPGFIDSSQANMQRQPGQHTFQAATQPGGPPVSGGPAVRNNLPAPPTFKNTLSTSGSASNLMPMGLSEPNSARSSRNPSPISNRRYDSMEGQFPSTRPSPVNSSANLQAMAQTNTPNGPPNGPPSFSSTNGPPVMGPSIASGPPHPPYPTLPTQPPVSAAIAAPLAAGGSFPTLPPPPATTQQFRPMVAPPYMGHTSPVVNQPQIGGPLTSPPPLNAGPPPGVSTPQAPTQPFTQRPRYPQQMAYSQNAPQPSSQQVPPQNSHPGYGPTDAATQGAQSGFQNSNVPEGIVGGVPGGYDPQMHSRMAGMSIHNSFSRMWGNDSINLLQDRHILPPTPVVPMKPTLPQDKANCSPDIFRCTVTKIPETSSLLQKSRLPLGILIHPFRDMSHLPVIQCNTIVRCRSCRTYINPFVTFVDQRRWKCNLCYRINDLPEEFFFDPVSGTYGDPTRRPEIKNATIEFIAPSEYMLRPPQPAIYLYVLDVSYTAIETGYLNVFCQVLLDELDNIPGDARTRIGFITFDSSIHFYNLAEGMNRPHMMVVSDIDEMFVPLPDNLLVNLNENKTLLQELLTELPNRFAHNDDTNSALGAALQAAYKMVSPVGGRVTVVQTLLPNSGPGALKPREDPNQRAAKDVNPACLGPASDFYKKLALDCSGQQVAMDLFILSSQYADVATLACASKFSSGCLNFYPGYHQTLNKHQVERFENDLRRYLTRKIGFEAVMRIRCTRGLSIHTFHGNFFVRSTDLLSLPNVNPDSGFGMQISIEENLTESNVVCFQAAVLYTSSKGERRIRVHTLSLPVSPNLTEIMGSADQQAIIGLLSKMAVDRSLSSSLSDARDALINACIDILSAFKVTLPASQTAGALMCPFSVRLVPLYAIALLKHPAFRVSISTKLDERVFAMEQMKTMPLSYLMLYIYPGLYPIHALDDTNGLFENDIMIPQPPILQLTFEKVDRHGAYLLDTVDGLFVYVGRAVSDLFCVNVLGVPNFSSIPNDMYDLPELDTPESNRVRTFISWILSKRPYHTPLIVMREDSKEKHRFLSYMADDRSESSFSYYEFLQHLKNQVSK